MVDFATALSRRLPATLTALSSGDIDYCKARTLWYGTALLDDALASHVEAGALTKAGEQTTGEIRAKIRRLIKKLDPGAFDHRRETAEKQRRVALTDDETGTAHLTGCDLPAAAATSAYNRINAIAAAIRADGDTRGIDQLRADVFLGLLHGGHDLPEPSAAAATDQNTPVEHAWTHLDDLTADFIARTIRDQLDTLTNALPGRRTDFPDSLDFPQSPDSPESPDFPGPSDFPGSSGAADPPDPTGVPHAPDPDLPGLLPSPDASDLASLPDRHCHLPALLARAAERISAALTDLKAPWCATGRPTADGRYGHRVTGYRPPAGLRRLVRHRDTRCRYPGCRRPADRADIDHTTPYEHTGPTCICNLAVLCRRHHKLKQTKHWQLIQLWPGVLLWITPTGHWRIVTPSDRE